MVFTVDVGNTNIVIGVYDNEKLAVVARVATEAARTADQYAIEFKHILELYGIRLTDIDGAAISTVVPPLLPVLKSACKFLFKCTPVVVTSGIKTGLNIKIDDPAALGADLVCAAVGALEKYPMPCIIFDLGTATTVSAIDKNGAFLGGAIFPGVRISLNALSSSAAQLPYVNLEEMKSEPIGKNSIDSMKEGIICGTAGMMDGLANRYKEVLGENTTILATGGISEMIAPYCKNKVVMDSNLLIDGLYAIYKKNSKK